MAQARITNYFPGDQQKEIPDPGESPKKRRRKRRQNDDDMLTQTTLSFPPASSSASTNLSAQSTGTAQQNPLAGQTNVLDAIESRISDESDGRFCPLCKKSFPSIALLNDHHSKCQQRNLRCECGKWLRTKKSLRRHKMGACTLLKEKPKKHFRCDCGQEFVAKHTLARHKRQTCELLEDRPGSNYQPQPLVECDICGTRIQIISLQKHMASGVCQKSLEQRQFCECQVCGERMTKGGLRAHMPQHYGPFYVCTVPNCVASVAHRHMIKLTMTKHMAKHEGEDHQQSEYPYKILEEPPPYVAISQQDQIREFMDSQNSKMDDLATLSMNLDPDVNTRPETDYDKLCHSATSAKRTETISQSIKNWVQQYNVSVIQDIENKKVSLEYRGHHCIGPRRTREDRKASLIQEKCPRSTVINFDTAKVEVDRGSASLNPRCVDCASEFSFTQLLRTLGTLAADDDKDELCAEEACTRKRMYRSKLCAVHLVATSGPRTFHFDSEMKQQAAKAVMDRLKGKNPWTLDPHSNFQKFLGRKSDKNVRFFALDCEGILTTSNGIRQAAAVDVETSEALFNVKLATYAPAPQTKKFQGNFVANFVHFHECPPWTLDLARLSGELVDRREAAARIKSCGIKSTDYIIVWHPAYSDPNAVREMLNEELGRDEVKKFLPPNENVIRLNFFFKHNLQGNVYAGLEFLFSLFFPTSKLTLTHHDALIDIRKTALMARLAERYLTGQKSSDLRGVLDEMMSSPNINSP